MHSRLARDRYFNDFFRYISNSGQFSKTRQFIQHGDTSVYSHCVAVAYVSLWFSYRLHLSVSKQSLLMGAFLHDYFLYDWHENDPSHRLHGFTHPKRALINATADWIDTNKIVYRFLTEILDVDEQTALAEADLMEHDISKGTRKKLKKFIKKSTDKKSADKKSK